jgi:hypothetical protein
MCCAPLEKFCLRFYLLRPPARRQPALLLLLLEKVEWDRHSLTTLHGFLRVRVLHIYLLRVPSVGVYKGAESMLAGARTCMRKLKKNHWP